MTKPGTLLSRVAALTIGMIGVATLGVQFTFAEGLTPETAAFPWGWAIAFIVSAIGVSVWASADKDNPALIIGAGVFSFCSGAFIGPCLGMYTATIGSDSVMWALTLTAGCVAAMGGLAQVASFDWRRVSSYLGMALWGLIGYLLVDIFANIPAGLDLGVSFIGAGIFTAFLLVDFMRLKSASHGDDSSWGLAVNISVNLFLDILNLLLWILRIIAASKK